MSDLDEETTDDAYVTHLITYSIIYTLNSNCSNHHCEYTVQNEKALRQHIPPLRLTMQLSHTGIFPLQYIPPYTRFLVVVNYKVKMKSWIQIPREIQSLISCS